jgi:hypothetical protein
MGAAAFIPGARMQAVRHSDKVAPEPRRVVVARIQGEPDGGATAAGGDSEPHAQQGGLTKTGGRRDEGELASQLFFQSLAKAQAANEGGVWAVKVPLEPPNENDRVAGSLSQATQPGESTVIVGSAGGSRTRSPSTVTRGMRRAIRASPKPGGTVTQSFARPLPLFQHLSQ